MLEKENAEKSPLKGTDLSVPYADAPRGFLAAEVTFQPPCAASPRTHLNINPQATARRPISTLAPST
jgi:hypothetical protein